MGDVLDHLGPKGPMYQSRNEWEGFYQEADPWGYVGRWLLERRRQEILRRIFKEWGPYERALDLGSGEGIVTQHLAGHCRSLVSVEISGRALQRQQALLRGDGRHFVHADVFRVSFRPESFDLVCGSEVLSYSHDRERVAAEWARWVRPGKLIMLVDALLPGYFSFPELMSVMGREIEILKVEALSSKHLLAKLANRKLIPCHERVYDHVMEWTRRRPEALAKHVCVIGRKRS
jgi:SAM-dependent methyltransferase